MMMTAEERSDALDEQLMVVPARLITDVRRIFILLGFTIAVLTAMSIIGFVYLSRIAEEAKLQSEQNYQILVLQIPGLQQTIKNRDAEINKQQQILEAQEYVLNKQAIPAIVDMGKIIEQLGGEPPKVLLSPTEPPYKPQATANMK